MKVVVVGCKGWGQIHLRALSALGVELEAMERDRAAAQTCQEKYGVRRIYSDYNSVLSSDADIIDLVVPHNLHRDMAVAAVKAGKHVLVEKPIARTVEEARDMIEAARAAGKKLMVTDQFYFDPAVRAVVDIIRRGQLGRVHTIIVRSQVLGKPTGWRTRLEEMGGGALIDGGVHFIDTLLELGGEYEEVKAYAYRAFVAMEGDDTSMALFKFKSGAYGLFFYSWAYPNASLLPSYEVIGDSGSVVEDLETKRRTWAPPRYRVYGDPVLNGKRLEVPDVDVFQEMFRGFIKAVEEGAEVPFPPELALRDLKAVLDVYRAAGVPWAK
ncbi:MAG: Gfo/Idh/MocA family protein [Thermoproteus sp. AZ2]|jgi:predicted dehydrogenase|uniref:Gfo/Idh/MocA family protein n=1 Tax=Thermoproteus sp. AZ2 TaxID=1609232 RepID=A0ACC6UY37_9CREN